ncbi:MAG TPA: DNA translocase FtsK [Patescibacteria group bacterium]|nr:DNA translocase FtsK [Patescibacteria group bacterium]
MAKKHKRRTDKRSFKLKLKPQTYASIAQVFFFALSFLIIISFSRRGLILVRFNDLMMYIFGWATLFLPFIFLSFAFLVSKIKIPLAQPNVIVGSILIFLSFAGLGKSGFLGLTFWDGVSTLVTPIGAVVIFFGIILTGLIILFNTSFDQVFKIVKQIFSTFNLYIFGQKSAGGGRILPRKDFKISGSTASLPVGNNKNPNLSTEKPKEELEEKLISNVKGEEAIWKYPPIDLFSGDQIGKVDRGDINGNADIIEKTLESFGITATIVEVNLGPAVTQYAIQVALGTKLSKITALERDLALALSAPTGAIRIEAPIPGRNLVGIELPNRSPEFVPIKRILESEEMTSKKSKLVVTLGLDVSGKPVIADLNKMPHVLIAGQTGSGKSVCINTFLASILYRASPSEVKFIMVDPKRVELTGYNEIPHLLSPVIVDTDKVLSALRWLTREMDRRYELFQQAGARNIDSYNEMSGFQALPYIVLLIDELADVMLLSPVEVEDAITRIAQMSRATGIHMVLATQRPSVNVITGLIKANIPCRIAFAVSSQVDSRVIMDTQGAEKLLGKGDMLYLPPDQAKPSRIQGAFVNDAEIKNLVSFIKNQGVPVQYTEEVTTMTKSGKPAVAGVTGETDDLFSEAIKVVCQYDRASASLLQRRLSIGYARAARVIDQLQDAGVIAPSDGSSKPREVLIKNADDFLASIGNK